MLAIGEAFPIDEQLALPGNLEHWASPTTYVEVDNARGYTLGKSSNMGSVTFQRRPSDAQFGTPYAVERHGPRRGPRPRPAPARAQRRRDRRARRRAPRLFNETLARDANAPHRGLRAGGDRRRRSLVRPRKRRDAADRRTHRRDLLDRLRAAEPAARLVGPHRRSRPARRDVRRDAGPPRGGFARERQFISDASHELKTPLTVIHSNAQLLERWGDRDQAVRAESLEAIIEESAGLARIVNGMLTLAKAESGDDDPARARRRRARRGRSDATRRRTARKRRASPSR